MSLDASICLGKLGCVNSDCAKAKLRQAFEEYTDWNKKSLALESLIRQFNVRNKETLEFAIHQLSNSPMWSSRLAAVKLLGHLGNCY